MARRPPLAVLAVAALVVLAGCPGSAGTDGTPDADAATPSPAPGTDTSTTDASTPVASPTRPSSETGPATGTTAPTPAAARTSERTAVQTPPPTPAPTPTSTPERRPTRTPAPTPTTAAAPRPTPTTATDRDAPAEEVGESGRVQVEGDLPVNATAVYRRVERLMNVSDRVPRVTVIPPERVVPDASPTPVETALGFGNETGDWQRCGAFASARASDDEVRIATGNLSPSGVELVLAHEYVHTLQEEVAGFENATRRAPGSFGITMVEGSAVYVADAYARRYDERWADKRPLEIRECLYRQTRNRVRTISGQYYFGGRYFAERLDSPSELSRVFADPPRTTEQLVHVETPASEPAAPLSVDVSGSETWREGRRRSGGELLVRTWLTTALPDDRVETAATGWGNDSLLPFRGPDRTTGAAWVLRWDSPADADEFASAVADLVASLESRNVTTLRSVRASEETVVVFAGPASFVANATASGTNESVTVTAP